MMRLPSLVLCAPFLLAAACSRPTEIVVKLQGEGGTPPNVTIKLHRTTPFSDDPAQTPSYVQPSLDGADLDLFVTPPGPVTLLSLLPAKGASSDLTVTVTAATGWTVNPATPVDATFIDGKSQEMIFLISAPVVDAGSKDGPRDAAVKQDQGADDGGAFDEGTNG